MEKALNHLEKMVLPSVREISILPPNLQANYGVGRGQISPRNDPVGTSPPWAEQAIRENWGFGPVFF